MADNAELTPREGTDGNLERKRQVEELARSIDLTKPGVESSFGKDAQGKLQDFSSGVLQKAQSRDLGDSGELLRRVVTIVSDEKLSGFKKVPIIGRVAVNLDSLRRNYQDAESQIDEIVGELRRNQVRMEKDIASFEQMAEASMESYRQLDLMVSAGRLALEEFKANDLPALQASVAESGDQMAAQELRDTLDRVDAFERRLDDLNRIRLLMVQQVTQIRLLQKADKEISDKIDTTVQTTIPVWRSQLVIALGLDAQRRALDAQRAVDDATNELIRKNSEMLRQGSVDAAKATQRAVVDMETLREANRNVISAVEETIKIQEEGRAAREAAWAEIDGYERELKDALVSGAQRASESRMGR